MRAPLILLASTAPLIAHPALAAPCSDDALGLLSAARQARGIVQHADELIAEQRLTGELAEAAGAAGSQGIGLTTTLNTLTDIGTCTSAGELSLSLNEFGLAFVGQLADEGRFSVDVIAMLQSIELSRSVKTSEIDPDTGDVVEGSEAQPILSGGRNYVGARVGIGPWVRLALGRISDSGVVQVAGQPGVVGADGLIAVDTRTDSRTHLGVEIPPLDLSLALLSSPDDDAPETIVARVRPALFDTYEGDFALGWYDDESLAVLRTRIDRIYAREPARRARLGAFLNAESTTSVLRSVGVDGGFAGGIGKYDGARSIGFGLNGTLGYSHGEAVRAFNDGAGLLGGTAALEAWWVLDFDLTVTVDFGVGFNDPDLLEVYPGAGGRLHGEVLFNIHYAAW